MNNFVKFLVVLGLCGLVAGPVTAELRAGMTREEVEAELGPPLGAIPIKGRLNLLYPDGAVSLLSNRVVNISTQFVARLQIRQGARAFEAEQKARGLVWYDRRWMPQADADRRQAEKVATAARIARGEDPKVREVREGGKRIDLESILVPGKITVVDFFADWCPPCRALSPLLVDLAHGDPDVHLCKIDVVNWQSEVAGQYELRSLPDVRVFDRNGRMVASHANKLEAVAAAVQNAK